MNIFSEKNAFQKQNFAFLGRNYAIYGRLEKAGIFSPMTAFGLMESDHKLESKR